MVWRGLRHAVDWYGELVLAVVFLGMAFYELLEMWTLESGRALLGPVLHGFQVVLIVGATWALLRGWRRKTAHARALTRLVERVVYAREEERRRIVYEIHDAIAPLIVSAKQHFDTARDRFARADARAECDFVVGLERLDRAIVETRRVLRALGPSPVAGRTLAEALRQNLAEAARESGWAAGLTENLGADRLPPPIETAIFRIFQESVANVARHARASRVDIELTRADGWVTLDVRDQGVGFEVRAAQDHGGLGLASMAERARLLGGTCTIESRPSGGTRILARLPLGETLLGASA